MEDLEVLIHWFLEQWGSPELKPGLLELLNQYHWPGNIRELKNVLERAVILAQGEPLARQHFPEELFRSGNKSTFSLDVDTTKGLYENREQLTRQLEKQLVSMALEMEDGDRFRSAKRLGISIKELHHLMKQLD